MDNAVALIVTARGEPSESESAMGRRSIEQVCGKGGKVASAHAVKGIDWLLKGF